MKLYLLSSKLNNATFSTPILLIAWRRPKETKEVIDSLKLIKPKRLFISCDGAREGNNQELEKVKKTQEMLKENINWDCEIKWQISKINLGCKKGVTKAINWFFENVSEGIILEDDIVAHYDFFKYCQYLLEKYRSDKRVWCISGSNNQDNIKRGNGTYYFGKIPLIWGWATWKDRWEDYDVTLKKWPEIRSSKMFESLFFDKLQCKHWSNIFETFYKFGKPDTWDYPWVFTCLINNGLTAIPNKNLIKNIGFNSNATHTKWQNVKENKIRSIGKEIVDPEFIICDFEAEKYQFDFFFGGFSSRLKNNPILRVANKLKRKQKN